MSLIIIAIDHIYIMSYIFVNPSSNKMEKKPMGYYDCTWHNSSNNNSRNLAYYGVTRPNRVTFQCLQSSGRNYSEIGIYWSSFAKHNKHWVFNVYMVIMIFKSGSPKCRALIQRIASVSKPLILLKSKQGSLWYRAFDLTLFRHCLGAE